MTTSSAMFSQGGELFTSFFAPVRQVDHLLASSTGGEYSTLLWNSATAALFAENLATLVQIIFWIIVATVTVLTYLNARRTFFQPMRAETYKQQILLLRDIKHSLPRTDSDYLLKYDVHNAVLEFGYGLRTSYAEEIFAIEDMRSELLEEIRGVTSEPQRRAMLDGYMPKWEEPEIEPLPETINENSRLWMKFEHRMHHSTVRIEAMAGLGAWENDSLTPSTVKLALAELRTFAEADLANAEIWVLSKARSWFGARIRTGKQLRYSADVAQYADAWQGTRKSSDAVLNGVRVAMREYLQPDDIAIGRLGS
ncbi:hypothetical protein [Clavibacter michiganensis]|uniref:hypothetical protein n=1 Tax=Clavibacter michiganensis TaxID=28447 RepID=UPI0029316EF2|nr:hypothetical protein [Clavibacter michiganensis]